MTMLLKDVFSPTSGGQCYSSTKWYQDNSEALLTMRSELYTEALPSHNGMLFPEWHESWGFARIRLSYDKLHQPLRFKKVVECILELNKQYGFHVFVDGSYIVFRDNIPSYNTGIEAQEWLATYPFWLQEPSFAEAVRETAVIALHPAWLSVWRGREDCAMSLSHSLDAGYFYVYSSKKDALELKDKLSLIKHPCEEIVWEVCKDDPLVKKDITWVVMCKKKGNEKSWNKCAWREL